MKPSIILLCTCFCCLFILFLGPVSGGSETEILPDTVAMIKPSIVGVGTVQKTRRPPNVLMATGFVILEGNHVLTNAHAIPEKFNRKKNEFLAVFSGQGKTARIHMAKRIAHDPNHDVALLSFDDGPLPAMVLENNDTVREGELVAFTGYPLGAILGLYASTSRGIISAITPIVIPPHRSRQVNREVFKRLQQTYPVYQLDATAYPGHSGSPLYNVKNGRVVGIINMVFVKGTKEHAITDPSGISYAIPVKHARNLLNRVGLTDYNTGE